MTQPVVSVPSEDESWRDWENKLDDFQQWRNSKHSSLVLSWWTYLFSYFFNEVSALPSSHKVCLDVGCGRGNYLSHLVKNHCSEGIGIDPLRSSVEASKHNCNAQGTYDRVSLILGVAEYLPLKEEAVNLCIMTGSLDHVNDPQQAADEFHRVLTRSGHLMLLETALISKQSNFYDETHTTQFTLPDLTNLVKQFQLLKVTRKFPVLSQIRLFSDTTIDRCFSSLRLRKIPGVVGSFFNYSEVLLECAKT
ncbi:MAG: class I SAM-dependent methyltransferase [Candidatus Bathyarchaeota archaeon]|nr:class I SAM-dependent methyltransferase [Candidatus Bathyarchaeota archaeon]